MKTVEQNDPTAITGRATPADAIVPFSVARLALWNNGYFHNPNAPFGTNDSAAGNNGHGAVPADRQVDSPVAGRQAPDRDAARRGAVYDSPITDYVIFRQSDASSTTPFEPGGSLNWVQALFSDPATPPTRGSKRPPGKALVQAAGVTPDYDDLGDVA